LSDTTDLAGLLFRVRWFSRSAIAKSFYSYISSAAFSTAALHQRPLNTQHCIYIWASRNSLRLWNCAQHAYSQL